MAHAPGVRGLIVYGETLDKLQEYVGPVARTFLEVCREHNDDVPEPLRHFDHSSDPIPIDLEPADVKDYIGVE